MRKPLRAVYWLALIAIAPTTHAYAPVTNVSELPHLVAKVLPSVVNISSTTVINYQVQGWEPFLEYWGIPKSRKNTSLGSGFIIDQNGFVLTNHHVVERASEVLVTMIDKKQYTAKIIGLDPKLDLALIQIRDKKGKVPADLKKVFLGDSKKVLIAEPVFAIGNPFGFQHTVTTGIISAKNRTIGVGPFDDFLQTDAEINPGNSGGPLFDYKGQVIGMNTLIYSQTGQSSGAGFATPINAIMEHLGALKRYGRIPRPWLGILAEKLDARVARHYRLPEKHGVLIYNLVQNGPADEAGLRRFDVITAINGKKIEDPDAIERLMAKGKINDRLQIRVRRRRSTLEIPLQLKELPRSLKELPQGII